MVEEEYLRVIDEHWVRITEMRVRTICEVSPSQPSQSSKLVSLSQKMKLGMVP